MYKDDYISAFGKLAPSEEWKAETLAKMKAIEEQGKSGAAGEALPPEKKAVPFAVRMRRAALPIAAVVALAFIPMTTLRGCGASNGSPEFQMQNAAAGEAAPMENMSAAAADLAPEPEPRDTVGGVDTAAPADQPSGNDGWDGGVSEEDASMTADTPQSVAPSPAENGAEPDAPDQEKAGFAYGSRPFGALTASDMEAAYVEQPPAEAIADVADLEELAALLNGIIVYEWDDSYTEYDGCGTVYQLVLADGTRTEIVAYNPFIIIDGVGYRTEYQPCAALDQYASELLWGA